MFDRRKAWGANQNSEKAQFDNFAPSQQDGLLKVAQATGSLADRVNSSESTVIQYEPTHTSLANIGIVPEEWFGNVTETIGKVRSVEQALVSQAVSRAQDLRKKAIISAVVIAGALLLLPLFSLLL